MLPSKGPNSPFSVGPRTLLARTCKQCGELYDADSFPILNPGKHNQARRKVCHKCSNLNKQRDRKENGYTWTPRPPVDKQVNKKQQWTVEQDNYLRENMPHKSYEEIALALGRSLSSVYQRRVRLGIAQVRKSHRVDSPWKVHNES